MPFDASEAERLRDIAALDQCATHEEQIDYFESRMHRKTGSYNCARCQTLCENPVLQHFCAPGYYPVECLMCSDCFRLQLTDPSRFLNEGWNPPHEESDAQEESE